MQLDDKTILITGATDGVGRCVAERLGSLGARVLVHGRNAARAEQVLESIRATGNDKCRFYPADLSSLAEVRRLADEVRTDNECIHVLINNAGIGSGGPGGVRQVSPDGHELRFAVNYLAGFLLTTLLLPTLRACAPARIVNVASAGQHVIDLDDVMLTRGYSGGRAYAQSKLAQIMFTFDLAQTLDGTGVTVNCLHPATYMDTTMVRQSGATPISTVGEGADAIMRMAVSPELEGVSGRYFNRQQPARAEAQAYDAEARERLRQISLDLTELAETPTARVAGL
ncbi:MAG TPA: SDR family NAD(P)-dependent oxidoreductase [Xanthobacteraceae bacterium]|nr:SDR family NAD(P)-dependent oxidoreductase [Xanthobacteraceae bacterium]